MNHLIIGAGNMGKRYDALLKKLGQTTKLVDLEFDPEVLENEYDRYDSVFICSPAETHLELIRSLPYILQYVEKPVVHMLTNFEIWLGDPSHVSCPWRFCRCFELTNDLDIAIGYKGDSRYWYLDLIHFVDLFWHRWGKPDACFIDIAGTLATARMSLGTGLKARVMSISLDCGLGNRYTRINGKPIHTLGPCSYMFEDQVKYWLKCLDDSSIQLNPIDIALARTNWLLRQVNPILSRLPITPVLN